jgi:hypothetical protein
MMIHAAEGYRDDDPINIHVSYPAAARWYTADTFRRCHVLSSALLAPIPGSCGREFFLRKQLALYQERHIKPQQAPDATRLALIWLGRLFDWRHALCIVQPCDLSPLASPRVPPILAVEIATGPPTNSSGSPGTHPSHGP